MLNPKKITGCLVGLFCTAILNAQVAQFSLATDFSLQRSIREGQQYWAVGQTVTGQFNFSAKNAAYAWFCYYTKGKFNNDITATAKSPVTVPQNINYTNQASLGFKEISIGWKHYFLGSYNAEDKWNLYTVLGLGLMLGVVENTQTSNIDTSMYMNPVLPGKANFKRLTYDVGLGVEKPVGGDVYLYLEGKSFIPSTDYPSDHLLVNHNAPLTINLSFGIRILFD